MKFSKTPCNECGGQISWAVGEIPSGKTYTKKCPACKGKGFTRQATEITKLKVPWYKGSKYKLHRVTDTEIIYYDHNGTCGFISIKLPHKIGDTDTFTCDCDSGYLATHRLEHIKCPQCEGEPKINATLVEVSVAEKECDHPLCEKGRVFVKTKHRAKVTTHCPQCKGEKQYNLVERWEE